MSLLEVDVSGLLEEYRADLIRIVAGKIRSKAKELVPVDSGDLKDSIEIETGGGTGSVFSDSEYALSVEFGAKAHMIPNAFGRGVTVMHPGQAPQPFLAPAVRFVKKSMARDIVESFRRVASKRKLPAKGKTVVSSKTALPMRKG